MLLEGDAFDKLDEIPSGSVHTVITSPPYWLLRNYEGKAPPIHDRPLGLERTPQEYVDNLIAILHKVKRVLHSSGTLWLNIDDKYSPGKKWARQGVDYDPEVPAKNLIGIPWKVAFALQDDGWILRADNIWWKRNAPPCPARDRTTRVHEHLFLLTKEANYFYDEVAIFEDIATGDHYVGDRRKIAIEAGGIFKGGHDKKKTLEGRNKRSVWDILTEATPELHFAAFPTKLVTTCIRAGTSVKGCCSNCKTPIKRIYGTEGGSKDGQKKTLGWKKQCKCIATDIIPCTVLDIFGGRGTVPIVAEQLQRNWIAIEKSSEYCDIIRQNVAGARYGLSGHANIEKQKGFFSEEDIREKTTLKLQ